MRNEHSIQVKEEKGLVDDLIGQRFGLLTVIAKSPRRSQGGGVYWICKCDCGNTKEILGSSLKRKDENRTISCGCLHKSAGEIYISQILNDNNISYVSQYRFSDFAAYSYDFALIHNGNPIRLIEFDGEQHFQEVDYFKASLEETQERDKKKNNYALTHNIPLVRIPYWERDNITLDILLGDKYLVTRGD